MIAIAALPSVMCVAEVVGLIKEGRCMSKKMIVAVVVIIGVIYLIWDGQNQSLSSDAEPVYTYDYTVPVDAMPQYDYTVPANAVPNPSWSDDSKSLCVACHGDGLCTWCEGSGQYEFYPDWMGDRCRTCMGSGDCHICGGSGWID